MLKRALILALVPLLCAPVLLLAQSVAGFIDPMPTARLKQMFPSATTFTPRGDKDPIYFTAYATDPAKTPGAKPLGWEQKGRPSQSRDVESEFDQPLHRPAEQSKPDGKL